MNKLKTTEYNLYMWSLVKLELSSIICDNNNLFKTGYSITLKQEQKPWNNNEVTVGLDLKVGKDERDSKLVVDYDDDLVYTSSYSSAVHFTASGQSTGLVHPVR
jgi:hypothetical protein